MHIDFHYYGTYAVARAAGLKPEVCQTIATAAQFVDDNADDHDIIFEDGARIRSFPTTHHLLSIENTELFIRDQRRVWVPFHFLPGGVGDTMGERLICREDSEIAQEMIGHCLSLSEEQFGLYLVGIAAHVYADTFSHYGFSGVSSRWNGVDAGTIALDNDRRDPDAENRFRDKYGRTMGGLIKNWRHFVDSVKSEFAEEATGALGHGAALKYPDFPYLKWSFSYDHSPNGSPRTSERDNVETFLRACERLYDRFRGLGENHRDHGFNVGQGFDSFREAFKSVLEVRETDRDRRCELWRSAAMSGDLFGEPEEIPLYEGGPWQESLNDLNGSMDSRLALQTPAFQFLRASAIYRTYVLRNLLPSHNLILD